MRYDTVMFFKSLKREILAVTLGLTIFISIITLALGVFTTQGAGSGAETATSNVLRGQAREILTQIAESAANQQDLVFEQTRNEASNLATYTRSMYENASVYNGSYWRFDDRVYRENGRFLNRASDVSTIFIPSFVVLDATERKHIELTAHLDFIAPSILANNPNIVAIYTTDKKGFSRYFPNIVLGNIAPPNYNTLQDVVFTQATPENNPAKNVVWSPLYDDPAGRGLMITASAPIYTKSSFEGIIGIDVLLNNIIETITAYSPIEGSYAFLVDKNGETIAFPEQAYKDILGRDRHEGEVRTNLASSTSSADFTAIFDEMTQGMEGFEA
ncbi:MAG: cache domain-containing protein, partial [Nitrososphaera sp.]|nr:cache domain-containing protein [Nitrososphaera sp.]